MTGWLAAIGVVALGVVFGVREYMRWRGRRWFGGMRSGSRPEED